MGRKIKKAITVVIAGMIIGSQFADMSAVGSIVQAEVGEHRGTDKKTEMNEDKDENKDSEEDKNENKEPEEDKDENKEPEEDKDENKEPEEGKDPDKDSEKEDKDP